MLRHGDYNDYLEAIAERPAAPGARHAPKSAPRQKRPSRRRARQPAKRRPSQRTQRLIRELETEHRPSSRPSRPSWRRALADPAGAGDHVRLGELGTRYQQVQEELAWKLLEWERIQAGDGLEV